MHFRDLHSQYNNLKPEIENAISETLNCCDFIMGAKVRQFEEMLAEYVGIKHCISCANGTDALYIVLHARGIGRGDAVFVPDFSFFATAEVVSLLGATPVFVDVNADTFNISPVELEKQIDNVLAERQLAPKVVIPVDLFGLPADYKDIERIASKYNLSVLEDAAQGFGGSIDGRMACSFGDASTTSFFPVKPLGCYGDGGAIFTQDDELANILQSIRSHGKGNDKYDNVRIGVNSRLDTLQAAILIPKLKAFAEYELKNIDIAAQKYTQRLSGIVKTPVIPDGYCSGWAQYTIKLPDRIIRDGLREFLKHEGIPTMVYYPKPLHRQLAFDDLKSFNERFPVSELLCDSVLSLPFHPYLTDDDIEKVTDAIARYLMQ